MGADIRTKFFDYIIPVIPIMDSRNAYTHLKNKLNDFPMEKDNILRKVALHINDMRSLQNIVNEFNLFKQIVDNKENEAKIFALVFYKNMYAQDYNLIDKKSGILYFFIQEYKLRKLHEEYFQSLDNKLNDLYFKRDKLKEEKSNSSYDIRKDIVCRFISKELWEIIKFKVKPYNRTYEADDLCENENSFIECFDDKTLSVGAIINGYDRYTEIKDNKVIEEYNSRSELVSKNRELEYKKTLKEIEEVKEKIRIRNAITLADLIKLIGLKEFKKIAEKHLENINSSNIIGSEQIEAIHSIFRLEGFEVLYYLLENGFIMQDYMMFRSIFHEGAISTNDNDYIKAVSKYINFEEANNNYALDNEENVLLELNNQNYISYNGAIHHQIIAYLLNSPEKDINQSLPQIISVIFNKPAEIILSILAILDLKFIKPDYFVKFIKKSMEQDNNYYLDTMISVLEGSGTDKIQTKIAVNMIASVCPKIPSIRDKYREFIKNKGYELISNLDTETIDPFLENIKTLGVIYNSISKPMSEIEYQAIKFIADKQMYDLNRDNFRIIVSALLQNENIDHEQIDNTPQSLLSNPKLKYVQEYVNNNIDTFVSNIFIHSNENSETIVTMLKHSSLSDQLKIEILKKMLFEVSDLSEFTDNINLDDELLSFHDMLYSYKHITPTWRAVLNYIDEKFNHEVFIEYIEHHAKTLQQQHAKIDNERDYKNLYNHIICNDTLSNETYTAMMSSIDIDSNFLDKNLSWKNLLRLIEANKLVLNSQLFDKITEIFISLAESFDTELFVIWFAKYSEEFFRDTDYYLRSGIHDTFLKEMLKAITTSDLFNADKKASLLIKYYDQCNFLLDNLNLSNGVILSLIALSKDDNMKIQLITKLINNGYKNKVDIEVILKNNLEEKSFSKIFGLKSRATINFKNKETIEAFLSTLQDNNLIRNWSTRENGKYSVEILKSFEIDKEPA